MGKKYHARAPKIRPFGADAFEASEETTLRWFGIASFLINSRGTIMMVDPLLDGVRHAAVDRDADRAKGRPPCERRPGHA